RRLSMASWCFSRDSFIRWILQRYCCAPFWGLSGGSRGQPRFRDLGAAFGYERWRPSVPTSFNAAAVEGPSPEPVSLLPGRSFRVLRLRCLSQAEGTTQLAKLEA